MTQEEKAKAYDRALEIAKAWHKLDSNDLSNDDLETLFPSLKESEDERIRKELIQSIKDDMVVIHKDECITWLEKQNSNVDNANKEYWRGYREGKQEILDKYAELEKQTKETNEPKFKVDDWVVDNNGKVAIIYDLQKAAYVGHYTDGTDFICKYNNEHLLHLWTIDDAKDGDVLCDYHEAYDNPLIFILKKFECVYFGLTRPSDYSSYCFLTASDRQRFKEGTYHHEHNIKPATKKQRDLLFQKMKEAGYEWNAENKELKKIEQKPACSDDKKLTDVSHEYFSELLENSDSEDINDYAYQVAYCMSHDWIEETATWDDVQKACKLGAEWKERHWNNSSTAWSEEDDGMLGTMEGWLDTLCEYLKDSSSEYIPDVESCINWLKSLKQKIGG